MKRVIQLLPKIFALTLLWGAVGIVVMYVEPEKIRDVLIPEIYLPFVGLVSIASWYSVLIVAKSFRVATGIGLIVLIALILMILQYMNWLIAIALGGMVVALGLTLVRKS